MARPNNGGTGGCNGGANCGTVFNLRPSPSACKSVLCSWKETVLYPFAGGADGADPVYGDLTFDQAGNIYGTTAIGGSNNVGTVSPAGAIRRRLDGKRCLQPSHSVTEHCLLTP